MKENIVKIGFVVAIVGILGVAVAVKDSRPETPRPGDEQEDKGAQHIQAQNSPEYDGAEPPTSGDHAEAVNKGVYQTELPDVNTIHNLEHGYIYVSYQPDLPQAEIDKMELLFFEPFSNSEFSPTKVIMAPRAANESPIVLSSWNRSQKFDSYDEEAMMQYYLKNVSKSPEPFAE